MVDRQTKDGRINLSSNELIHPAVESILEYAMARLKPSTVKQYAASAGAAAMISNYFGIPSDELLLTPGSDAALRLICVYYSRCQSSTQTILLQYPNYYAWEQSAAHLGLDVRRVHWKSFEQQGTELLLAAADYRGALVALSTPNGPVGGCLSSDHLAQLVKVCRQQDHLLVIDSCYQAFNGGIAEAVRWHGDNVLVVQSLSKSHALAGARLGVVCGTSPVIERLALFQMEWALSGVTLALGCALLDCAGAFDAIWQEVKSSRGEATAVFSGAGIDCLPSGGNFLTFRVGSHEGAEQTARYLSERGYRVKHLGDYPEFADCLRITIGDVSSTRTAVKTILTVMER